jgi:hypoxanthine phosphoribosyltransferase
MPALSCELRSWGEMRTLSEVLAKKIESSGFRPDYIVAIVRGGMVPAMNLSDILGVYDVLTLRVRHWGATAVKNKKAVLDVPLNVDIVGKKILLVDDLTDTGDSIRLALVHLKGLRPAEVRSAVLIHKASSSVVPDYYAEKEAEWMWVIFPWNLFEDLTNLSEKVIEAEGISSPQQIRASLKKSYSLDVDLQTLRKVLARGRHL